MPVEMRRAELSGANLIVFWGKVTAEDLLRKFDAIDHTAAESSQNWLVVDMGSADISELTFEVLARLKAILAPKMAVMKARRPFEVVIVCQRPLNEPIYLAWQSFVRNDPAYPSRPLLFPSLRSACDHLGYAEREYDELLELCTAAS